MGQKNEVRERRIRLLLTQDEAAERAGVSRYVIQRAEAGDRISDLSQERIARLLGVDRGDLFPEDAEVAS